MNGRALVAAAALCAFAVVPARAADDAFRVLDVGRAADGRAPIVYPASSSGAVPMYEDQLVPDGSRVVAFRGSGASFAVRSDRAAVGVSDERWPQRFTAYAVSQAPERHDAEFAVRDAGTSLAFTVARGQLDVQHAAQLVLRGRGEPAVSVEAGTGAQRALVGIVRMAAPVVNVVDAALPGKPAAYPLRAELLRKEFDSETAARAQYARELSTLLHEPNGDPRRPSYRRRLAFAYNNEGVAFAGTDRERALRDFARAIAQHSDRGIAYYNRGLVYATHGDYGRALADDTEAIALNPDDSSVYNNRGVVYSLRGHPGDLARAITDYRKAVALDASRTDPTPRTNLGLEYLRGGHAEEAVRYLKEAVAVDPHDGYAFNDLAVAYLVRNDDRAAESALTRAIALHRGGVPQELYNRGVLEERTRDFTRARDDYAAAAAGDASFSEAFDREGTADHALGHDDAALRAYDRAIALDPRRARYYGDRAVSLLALNRVAAARDDLTRAESLGLHDATTLLNLGGAYFRENDLRQALNAFDAALKDGAPTAEAYEGRAAVYRAMGRLTDAEADETAALRLRTAPGTGDPQKTAITYDARGEIRQESGDLNGAAADFGEAIRLDPRLARAYANRGAVEFLLGDRDRARADDTTALQLDANEAGAWSNLGAMDLEQQRVAQARDELGKAAALRPADAYLALLREVADREAGATSIAQAAPHLDMTTWPAPIVRMYLGQLTPDATIAEARNSDPAVRDRRVCQATLYAADLQRLAKNEADALARYRSAATLCPAGSSERIAATFALNASK
jgi:tetratricopeptide (TPR) repeat protein